MSKVVHCKKEKYDIYIGRPSIWGNPFVVGKDGDRKEVIIKFRHYILNNHELLKKCREELKDKVLGCWCAPKNCHGDVLIEIAQKTIYGPCGFCEGWGRLYWNTNQVCDICGGSGYSGV